MSALSQDSLVNEVTEIKLGVPSVSFTTPAHPATPPPTTAPVLLTPAWAAVTDMIIDVSSLSGYKMLQVVCNSGNVINNNAGEGRTLIFAAISDYIATPADGAAFTPFVFVQTGNAANSDATAFGIVWNNNSTMPLNTVLPANESGQPNGDNIFLPVTVPYPYTTGKLCVWARCGQGSGRAWFDSLDFTVTGVA